jgi:hypothetical protein
MITKVPFLSFISNKLHHPIVLPTVSVRASALFLEVNVLLNRINVKRIVMECHLTGL